MASVTGKAGFSDMAAEEAAKSLKAAMKGVGTDEKRIIKDIIGHSNEQRQLIKQKYLTMYGKALEEDLKSELGGHFEEIVLALLKPHYEYEAENLHHAVHGAGTNEQIVIDVLCTKEGDELKKLKDAYKKLYNKELENSVAGESGGDLGKVFRSLAAANRPSGGQVDSELANKEAKELFEAGAGKTFGTDESELVRILVSRSFVQLRATFDEYTKIYSRDIEKSVQSETSGDFEKALVAIVESVRNRPQYFAKRIHQAVNGAGTKDKELVRLVVSRAELDLGDVKREYLKLFNKPLADVLKSELSGHFEDIMVALLG